MPKEVWRERKSGYLYQPRTLTPARTNQGVRSIDLDPAHAVFTTDTGVSESTLGGLRIVHRATDHDARRPNLRGGSARTMEVCPDDAGVETIFGVVGDSSRLFFGVIGDDTENGTEDIFRMALTAGHIAAMRLC